MFIYSDVYEGVLYFVRLLSFCCHVMSWDAMRCDATEIHPATNTLFVSLFLHMYDIQKAVVRFTVTVEQ